jgi:general secretion pathway protein H
MSLLYASRRRRQRAEGFTLLELLVVLTIFSLVTTVTAISARRPSNTETRVAALELAADLRALRDVAVTRQVITSLAMDEILGGQAAIADGRYRRWPAEMVVTLARGRPPLVGEINDRIVFFPDGSSTGGTITLALGTSIYAIQVRWIDGGVSVNG